MAIAHGRDRHGRIYWYDTATGRRTRAPVGTSRPLAYRVDKRGHAYWLWLDTGQRAPRPSSPPRRDSAGRALDSIGRHVPRTAFAAPAKPTKPTKPTKPSKPAKPTKPSKPAKPSKKKRGRPRKPLPPLAPPAPPPKPKPPELPRKLKVALIGPHERIPGFTTGVPPYESRPNLTPPRNLPELFRRRLAGALSRSPLTADEVGFRQYGVMFNVHAPLTTEDFARLAAQLRTERVQVVFRKLGAGRNEVWLNMRLPERRTRMMKQLDNDEVRKGFKRAERIARDVYDFFFDEDTEFAWYLYFETDDHLYEG